MAKAYNLTRVKQVFGQYTLLPGKWSEVSTKVAVMLATSKDFIVDSADLLEHFRFVCEDGTYLGWSSPFHYADGYGSVGQEIANAFIEKLGVALSIYPRDYDPSNVNFGSIPLEQWSEKAFVPESIVEALRGKQAECLYGVNFTFPRDVHLSVFPHGIGYTMFETTKPPVDWITPMNMCRRLIVPCEQNREAFREHGVTTPIHVVPLGINPEQWQVVDRAKVDNRPHEFTFLMAAGITLRKNPVGAARAFVAAFENVPDVRLILKTRGENTAGGFHDWRRLLPNDPRISVVCEESTPAQMLSWMHVADAFVFPSHGEGFGLTPLQAMCTGLPVIVSDNSGMSQYCNEKYNYPVPCTQIKVPHVADGGFPPEWGDVGNWWEPDFEALVERYREVYRHRDKAYRKGMHASRWVENEWNVERTCNGLLDVVMQDAREDGLL